MTVSRVLIPVAALLAGAACALAVGCGDDGDDAALIPPRQADAMIEQLDAIERSVRRGRCANVDTEIAALQTQVNDLSSRVDAGLRARLQEGVDNLATIAPDECFEHRDSGTTATTPTQTTTTETTPTPTTPTQTTTTPPATTEPPPATTTEPPATEPPATEPPPSPGGATVPDAGQAGGATPTP